MRLTAAHARVLAALAATTTLSLALLAPAGASAETAVRTMDPSPPVESTSAPGGEPWVVSLGDSYISGEAGRWAGNESGGTSKIDALGRAAYWDAGSNETIERCHRSRSAAIHIGVVRSLNLACSGAITSTRFAANSDPASRASASWCAGADESANPGSSKSSVSGQVCPRCSSPPPDKAIANQVSSPTKSRSTRCARLRS